LNVFVQQTNETELIAELYDFSGRLALTQVIRLQNNHRNLLLLIPKTLMRELICSAFEERKYYDMSTGREAIIPMHKKVVNASVSSQL
jgi:hypothetical protein